MSRVYVPSTAPVDYERADQLRREVLKGQPMTQPRSFDIEVTNSFTMQVGDIWPDGEAPENPTAEDVIAEMKKAGPMSRVLDDWCLLDGAEISVTDPEWKTAVWG